MPRPAVFLDRDDTLIRCRGLTADGDLGDPDLVELLPGAVQAIDQLHEAGLVLVVVSNQGGVARGKYTLDDVRRVNERVNELVAGRIEAFYVCPWHPQGVVPQFTREHPWRKPQPGMLLQAAQDHSLDLARSWLIGDASRDIEAGLAAGCRTVLVGADFAPQGLLTATAPDLPAAARLILQQSPA